MEVGISTACFYPSPVEENLDRLAGLGADCAEIFFNTFSEMRPPFTEVLRGRLAQSRVRLVSVHPFTSLMEGILLFSAYERRTEEGMALYRDFFRNARALGASYLTLHGERHIGKADSTAETERKLAAYRRLCDIAEEEGMVVAQENVVWCRSSDPSYLKLLVENVPKLRYTFDVKQARRAGRSWEDYLPVVGNRLVNIHINDYDGERSCLLPGEGKMEYRPFFEYLRSIGYDAQVLVEVYASDFSEDSQFVRALRYLREIVAEVY